MTFRRFRTAALIAAIVLPLLSTPAYAQQPVGWLALLLTQYNGVFLAHLDRQGALHWGWSQQALFVPPSTDTKIVNTAGGLLVYDPVSGAGSIKKVLQTGQIQTAAQSWFSPGWDHIVGSGTFLFFFNSVNRSGAIGHITPAGTFVQTQSWGPGSFAPWTDVVATDNNVIFYNEVTGYTAVGYVSAYGRWFDTAQTYLLPNCDSLTGMGGYLLCVQYNQRQVQVIDLEVPGNPVITHTLELARNYDRVIRHGSDVVMYQRSSGWALFGHIDENGQFVETDNQLIELYIDGSPFGAAADQMISTGDALAFYWPASGNLVVGRVDRTGIYHELQSMQNFQWITGFVATAGR
jgi:hypothetical protein